MSVNVRNTSGFMRGFELGDARLSYLGLFNPSMVKTQCRRAVYRDPSGHDIVTLKRSGGQRSGLVCGFVRGEVLPTALQKA